MSPIARIRIAAPLVMVAALAAGCGGGSSSTSAASSAAAPPNGVEAKDPAGILQAALAAAKGAKSVHIHGAGGSSGDMISLDMHYVAGQGAAGHITASGISFDTIRIGDKVYLKGGDDLWRKTGGEAAVQLFHDRWIVVPPTGSNFSAFAQFTDLDQLVSQLLQPEHTVTKGTPTSVAGISVIGLQDGDSGTLYVATTGKPYPIEVAPGSGSTGSIAFDAWDQPYTLTAPPDAIDVSQLQQ
jgi:hypothetical protein